MKKLLSTFAVLTICSTLFAYNPKNTSVERMYNDVSKSLKHKIEKYEQNIIDATYLYYYRQCCGDWTESIWNNAVSKSVSLCRNPAAVTASKAGNFGEKFLQAVIVTAEDAFHGARSWLNNKSSEYEKRRK